MPDEPTNEATEKLPTLEDLHKMGINITNGEDAADYIDRLRSGNYEPAPARPDAALRVDDERAADTKDLAMHNPHVASGRVLDLLADRAAMQGELRWLREVNRWTEAFVDPNGGANRILAMAKEYLVQREDAARLREQNEALITELARLRRHDGD